jgi:hypothetical protein
MLDSIYFDRVCLTKGYDTKRRKSLVCAAVLVGLALMLGGCGKRPGHVDAPPGTSEPFPGTYPDPSLDPRP